MEFEDILELTGGFGKFQQKLTVLFVIPAHFIIPWFWLNRIFILSVPQHWCNVPELEFSNLTIDEQRTLISPPSDPSCSMHKINYTEMFLRGIFKVPNDSEKMPCVAGWKYDTKDYEETAGTKWNLVCDYDYYPMLILTLANVGTVLGTSIYGYFSDKFGRKVVFLTLAGLVVVTEIASALVTNFVIFVVLRSINGSCIPSMCILPYILTVELVAPNMRAHINGIINTSWTVGLCLLPLVAFLSRDWKTLCFITAGAGMVVLSYSRFIYESPSWLLSQGRFEEAKKIMTEICKVNGNSNNHTQMISELQILGERIKQEKEEYNKYPRSFNILGNPKIRRHLMILSFCWMSFNVTFSGLTYNLSNLHGNEFINFFLISVVEFPGNFAFWYAMDKFGRRWTTSFGFFLTGAFCLLPLTGFQYSEILSSMIGKFLMTGVYMVVDQQGTELFPTVVRSFCIGTGKTISNTFALISPFLAYSSLFGKTIPFIILSAVCFLACIFSSTLPETLNEKLPQTITDAENIGKDQKFFTLKKKTLQ